jgi:hypothetical protein
MTLHDQLTELLGELGPATAAYVTHRQEVMDEGEFYHPPDDPLADAMALELATELARARSWDGVEEFIDKTYPAEAFDGSSGDPGPRLLVMLRATKQGEAELERARNDVFGLSVALEQAEDRVRELEAMLDLVIHERYAFAERHYDEYLAHLRRRVTDQKEET